MYVNVNSFAPSLEEEVAGELPAMFNALKRKLLFPPSTLIHGNFA